MIAGLLRFLGGFENGITRRAHVIDHDNAGTRPAIITFNAPLCAVTLCLLSNDEGRQRPSFQRADYRYCSSDWIGAHREATDRVCLKVVLLNVLKNETPDQQRPSGVERCHPAIQIIGALFSG